MPHSRYIREDAEINIRDMFGYCLLHWRSAVAVVAISGIMIGGYCGLREYKYVISKNEAYDRYDSYMKKIADENIEFASEDAEEKQVEKVVGDAGVYADIVANKRAAELSTTINSLRQSMSQKENYINNSEFMLIDPYDEAFSRVSLLVSMADKTDTKSVNTIIEAIKGNIVTDDLKKQVSEKTGISESDVANIIDVSVDLDDSDKKILNDKDGSTGLLIIDVIGRNQDNTSVIADIVKDRINQLQTSLKPTGGAFSLSFLDTISGTRQDFELSEKQSRIESSLTDIKASIESNKTELQTISTSGKSLSPKSAAISVGIKNGGVAAFALFFAYGFGLCLVYILGQSFLTQALFLSRYDMCDLGSFRSAKKSLYRNRARFDSFIRNRMGISAVSDDDEVVCNLISTNIDILKPDAQNIIIVGSTPMDDKVMLASKLSEIKKNVTFIPCNAIVESAEDRRHLKECDGVVLFEKYGKSKYTNVDKVISAIESTKNEIIGYVME